MATAFAEQERDQRGLNVEIITGGVDPANSVHEEVIDAMQEVGIDTSDRTPREITPEDIEDVDHVVTMGCSVEQFRPDDWSGDSTTWDLSSSDTRGQRDELNQRVKQFFDELQKRDQV